jgi:hypothetical protein
MKKFASPLSLVVSAFAIVLIVAGVSGLLVGQAFASPGAPWQRGGPWQNGAAWHNGAIPQELSGLADVPAGERFAHFRGVQVQLTDKDNHPVRVDVTPGTVTSVSNTSLTVSGNDGASHTYTLTDKTVTHGQSVAQNDQVIVATLNGSTTATAVIAVNGEGWGPRGPWGH